MANITRHILWNFKGFKTRNITEATRSPGTIENNFIRNILVKSRIDRKELCVSNYSPTSLSYTAGKVINIQFPLENAQTDAKLYFKFSLKKILDKLLKRKSVETTCDKKKMPPLKKKKKKSSKKKKCNVQLKQPCLLKTSKSKLPTPCHEKKEDNGKKEKDPCKKKEDSCKEKEDPCKEKKEKEDPCKEKKEDPCKKKEDPCKKKKDSAKQKGDSCKKKDSKKKKDDPCKKKEDPCKKKPDSCKKKEDPSKKKEDPCKKKEDPSKKKEDPCKKKEDPSKKKEDPCKKKEDPCKKKEDPSKKKKDPCKKKEDPCKKKEDPCKKKEDPCKKKEDPCKKKEDPCKKKDDPCKKTDDPCKKKEDPCKKKEDSSKKKDDPCGKKEDSSKKKDDPCAKMTSNEMVEIKGVFTSLVRKEFPLANLFLLNNRSYVRLLPSYSTCIVRGMKQIPIGRTLFPIHRDVEIKKCDYASKNTTRTYTVPVNKAMTSSPNFAFLASVSNNSVTRIKKVSNEIKMITFSKPSTKVLNEQNLPKIEDVKPKDNANSSYYSENVMRNKIEMNSSESIFFENVNRESIFNWIDLKKTICYLDVSKYKMATLNIEKRMVSCYDEKKNDQISSNKQFTTLKPLDKYAHGENLLEVGLIVKNYIAKIYNTIFKRTNNCSSTTNSNSDSDFIRGLGTVNDLGTLQFKKLREEKIQLAPYCSDVDSTLSPTGENSKRKKCNSLTPDRYSKNQLLKTKNGFNFKQTDKFEGTSNFENKKEGERNTASISKNRVGMFLIEGKWNANERYRKIYNECHIKSENPVYRPNDDYIVYRLLPNTSLNLSGIHYSIDTSKCQRKKEGTKEKGGCLDPVVESPIDERWYSGHGYWPYYNDCHKQIKHPDTYPPGDDPNANNMLFEGIYINGGINGVSISHKKIKEECPYFSNTTTPVLCKQHYSEKSILCDQNETQTEKPYEHYSVQTKGNNSAVLRKMSDFTIDNDMSGIYYSIDTSKCKRKNKGLKRRCYDGGLHSALCWFGNQSHTSVGHPKSRDDTNANMFFQNKCIDVETLSLNDVIHVRNTSLNEVEKEFPYLDRVLIAFFYNGFSTEKMLKEMTNFLDSRNGFTYLIDPTKCERKKEGKKVKVRGCYDGVVESPIDEKWLSGKDYWPYWNTCRKVVKHPDTYRTGEDPNTNNKLFNISQL